MGGVAHTNQVWLDGNGKHALLQKVQCGISFSIGLPSVPKYYTSNMLAQTTTSSSSAAVEFFDVMISLGKTRSPYLLQLVAPTMHRSMKQRGREKGSKGGRGRGWCHRT